MVDNYTTRTPGQILRAAREERGANLLEAAEGTKIPPRLLEAIERDEYHKLSGPLYVKSFLRNYAGWLGLNEGEVLGLYEVATGRPEQTPNADDQVWTEDQVAVTKVGVPWTRLVVIAIAVTVLLAVLVAVGIRIFAGGDDDAVGQAPDREDAVVATVAESTPAVTPAVTPAPEPPTGSVQSKVQPNDRNETSEERLARLSRDTLLGGPQDDASEDAAAETTETASETVTNVEPPAPTPAATITPPARSSDTDLAPPRRGDRDMRFTGGQAFALVLRVVISEPANCTVRRDDDATAAPVIWPDNPAPPPAYNVRHGLAYAVRGGYAVYWGADDHFTLTLDRVQDVEITLNGEPLSLRNWRPGQTKLLDRSSLPAGG